MTERNPVKARSVTLRLWLLAFAVGAAAGAGFHLAAPEIPEPQTSTAYLRMDKKTADSLSIQRTNPSLADAFLGGLPYAGPSTAARVQHLMSFVSVIDTTPEEASPFHLYAVQMTNKDPGLAQKVLQQMIDEWLRITPSADPRVVIKPPDFPPKRARQRIIMSFMVGGIMFNLVILGGMLWRRVRPDQQMIGAAVAAD